MTNEDYAYQEKSYGNKESTGVKEKNIYIDEGRETQKNLVDKKYNTNFFKDNMFLLKLGGVALLVRELYSDYSTTLQNPLVWRKKSH